MKERTGWTDDLTEAPEAEKGENKESNTETNTGTFTNIKRIEFSN